MAGERYIGTDESGRPRYLGGNGKLLPAGFSPTKKAAKKAGKKAGSPRRPSSPWVRGSMDAFMRAAGGVDDASVRRQREKDTGPIRQVSLMGVDPRSAEGQEIMDLLAAGMTPDMPEVQALVEEYQGKLLGPVARKTRDAKVGNTGMYQNQYGFTAGDEFRQLDILSTEILVRTQDRMAALGILGKHIPGRKDPATLEAFRSLLTLANTEGEGWANMLHSLEEQKIAMGDEWAFDKDGNERAPFTAQAYLAPDYATLANAVRTQMRGSLGRDPDDSEIAQLTAELEGWYREEYDEEVEAARREYEMEGTDEGGVPEPGVDIDPEARFREAFETRFANGIQWRQEREEDQSQAGLVQGSAATIGQAMRGN